MSTETQKILNQEVKIIEVGKFYFIHDQSLVGHPGLIIWKSDENNLYLPIKFGSSPNAHNIKFTRPVGDKVKTTYIYKRPFLGKRRDFSKKELTDMNITIEELSLVKELIDLSNPVYSQSINRKSKRAFKRLNK